MKVVFAVPTIRKPYQATLDALAASVPLLDAAGLEHAMVSEIGCPYISAARSKMLRKALDAQADVVVFIDHDVSWAPGDLLKLIQTEGDVVAGTYRFKRTEVEYMGQVLSQSDGTPIVRESDGALSGFCAPAGFLKVTRRCVQRFIEAYPELCYGDKCAPSVDLFNHGAHKGVWYGEDYAFCRNWRDAGGELWIVPDMDIDHHAADGTVYPGNFHQFLLRQPGGSEAPQ
jgi:glycosyltransferase involved in cell wall biosynthesis